MLSYDLPMPQGRLALTLAGVAGGSAVSGDEADELVDGDDEDGDHEMAPDLGRTADADGAAAGLVLEAAENALDGGPRLERPVSASGRSITRRAGFAAFWSAFWAAEGATASISGTWPRLRLCFRISAAS